MFPMRFVFVCVVPLLVTACGKTNPDLCCVDEADCASVGLSDVTGCGDGLVCRGNQCLAEVCEASSECEASAPYCVAPPDGRCQETCTTDTECPGFGDSSSQVFCASGACVECRQGMNDCSGDKPVCSDDGVCVACSTNADCDSEVCDAGTCVDESMIAYVALTGTQTGECTKAAPCSTIGVALALTPSRPFIVIASGTYTSGQTLDLLGTRHLIGFGPTPPIIKRTLQGPIITISDSEATLENLRLDGASGSTNRDSTGGMGLLCNPSIGASQVHVVDSQILSNVIGLSIRNCTLTATRTLFLGNSSTGIDAVDADVTVDACTFDHNGAGANADNGTYSFTNSIFSRNTANGLTVFFFDSQSHVEFNTMVDNGGDGFNCQIEGATNSFGNNIIARNMRQTNGTGVGCTYAGSIIIDSDITPLRFVSPDIAPFDYHIQAGSMAIGQAVPTMIDHDIDGDPGPRAAPTSEPTSFRSFQGASSATMSASLHIRRRHCGRVHERVES